MTIKHIIIISLLTFLVSCDKNQIRKEYYSSGELHLELEINDERLKNGYYKEFYKNGELKTKAYYKDNVYVDTLFTYFDSGKIQSKQFKTITGDSCFKYGKDDSYFMKGKIIDNRMSGWYKMVFANGIVMMRELINVPENNVYENQNIAYNSQNDILDSISTYYEIKIKDTIQKGKPYDIEFIYFSPYINSRDSLINSSVNFYFGKQFDNAFSNKKDIKIDSLTLKKDKLKTNITYNNTGRKYIRGYFSEYTTEITGYSKDSSDVNMELMERKLYFEKEIYVTD